MLPGEEFWFERVFHALPTYQTVRSYVLPPRGDGSRWWLNPQVVSGILLAFIAVLLTLQFQHEARAAPRKIARRIRRIRQRHRDSAARQTRAPGRLRKAFTRLTLPPAMRVANDFVQAREMLEVRLDAMVGLTAIKAHLLALLDVLEMDERRRRTVPHYSSHRGCMHMVFLGNPGTGKTAVAQLIAHVLKEIGVLRKGQLVIAKKADLLGRYSNHVARNTRQIIEQAIGGVLFIDEAYSLLQGEADLGREVINVLVDMCYARREDLVVILAGYSSSMGELFEFNPGLASRFPHKFSFGNYSVEELRQIAQLMLQAAHFTLADAAAGDALTRLVAPIASEVPCGNARSVENRIAAAISTQSTRLRSLKGEAVIADEAGAGLFQLTAEDFDDARAICDRATAVLDSTSLVAPV